MLISEYGWIKLKNGELYYKKTSELNNSNHRVLISCDECNSEFETIWSNRKKRINDGKNDLCQTCSKSGARNSQYGKDRRKLCEYSRSFVKDFSRKFSDETKQKMSRIKAMQISSGNFDIKSNNRGRKFWYFSKKNNTFFHADSALEMFRMTQLDDDVSIYKWTKRHYIRIKYEYKGAIKNTVPDFLIELNTGDKIIEEVKGRVTEIEIAKKIAIENYCIKNNFLFVYSTQKELNKNNDYRKFLKTIK